MRTKVLDFYGRKCVITGEPNGIHLHHINEDRSDTLFANLAPVGGTYNDGIKRGQLNGRLNPHSLRWTAKGAFDDARDETSIRASYACNRIAAHLFQKYFPPTHWTYAAEALVFALADLRPEGVPQLLVDTAAYFVGLIEKRRSDPWAYKWSAEFISQLSLVMYDHMDVPKASALRDLATRLSERAPSSEPGEQADRLGRMLKRAALVQAPFARSAVDVATANMVGRMKEVGANARHDPHGRVSAEFTRATLQRAVGETARAIEIAEEAIGNSKGADAWTIGGLNIELAIGFSEKNDVKRARWYYETALRRANKYGFSFIPVPERGDLKDPVSILAHEFGKPMPPISRRGANPFSEAMINSIVTILPPT